MAIAAAVYHLAMRARQLARLDKGAVEVDPGLAA
jgi:hypothetical protein